jgi:hypothetical protein
MGVLLFQDEEAFFADYSEAHLALSELGYASSPSMK